MAENGTRNALFVCFGGMSNVGTLTGLAGFEAVKQVGLEEATIFCLGGLPTGAPSVLEKTNAVERIITVDGCALNCARKIVEQAGFTPDRSITLVNDCKIAKGPTFQYSEQDMAVVVETIVDAIKQP
ncbi:MAG: putative zinc-binding protein [Anaerolineales bacterium]|nr:putative zinc-binding protein [Anaerolineales bacterium]